MSFRSGACHKYPGQLRMAYVYGHQDRSATSSVNRCKSINGFSSEHHSMFGGHSSKLLASNSRYDHLDHLNSMVAVKNVPLNVYFSNTNALMQKEQDPDKPTIEQIEKISSFLEDYLPRIFRDVLKTHVLDANVEYQDNIRNVRTIGIAQFRQSVNILKIWLNFRYLACGIRVLSINKDLENGQIRIRFRIIGEKSLMKFFNNIKASFGGQEQKSQNNDNQDWIDVISTFTVNKNGLISKIVCDNILPDENKSILEQIPTKVAAFLGLAHDF